MWRPERTEAVDVEESGRFGAGEKNILNKFSARSRGTTDLSSAANIAMLALPVPL
ncbi:hypothetical protein E2562_037838, partial [Oryza meyeriana var. granulata]